MTKISELTELELQKQYEDIEDEQQPDRPRYIIRDAAFALSDLPDIEYIVAEVVTSHSTGIIYGKPGTKKTYSLVHLAVCVAMDKAWLGFDVKGCKVLIIDEESGELRISRRIGMTIRGEFGNEEIPIEYVSMANFKLDKKEDLPEIQQLIEKTGAKLVIIDALADVMDGDENSKQDIQPVFNTLRKLSELTGSTIIVVHHSNKSGGYRGSSAMMGAVDFMFKVQSDPDSDYITFINEKQRDGIGARFTAQAHWSDGQFWLTPAEPRAGEQLSRSQNYVVKYLTKHGPSTTTDIASAADVCSPESARRAIYDLAEKRIVYRTNPNEKGRGVTAIYALVKDDKDD